MRSGPDSFCEVIGVNLFVLTTTTTTTTTTTITTKITTTTTKQTKTTNPNEQINPTNGIPHVQYCPLLVFTKRPMRII